MASKITPRDSNGGTETPVSPEEATSHLEKVLQSSIFRVSETSRQLLLFLAKSTSEDPSSHPKEHEIATRVLGRGPEFDPRVDSVVRVQIGRLRSKLAEYYVSEGSKDEVMIQIPKGEYQLSFHRRGSSESSALEHALGAPASLQKRNWRRLSLFGLATLAVILTIITLYFQISATKNASAQQVLPWSVLLRSDRRLHLILSDP